MGLVPDINSDAAHLFHKIDNRSTIIRTKIYLGLSALRRSDLAADSKRFGEGRNEAADLRSNPTTEPNGGNSIRTPFNARQTDRRWTSPPSRTIFCRYQIRQNQYFTMHPAIINKGASTQNAV
jgi:hypothetical protein